MKENMFLDAVDSPNFDKKNLIVKKNRYCKTTYCNILDGNKDYYTISFDEVNLFKNSDNIEKSLIKVLKEILKSYNKNYKVLVVGLGNSSIDADSLGPTTIKNVMASYHYNDFLTIPKVALFAPEVINKTGINPFKLIKMITSYIKPDIIFVIDSMKTNNPSNLNNAIEINNVGIIKKESINSTKEITTKTFNIPVIAIMAPLLLTTKTGEFTTPNTKMVIESISKIIANSLNHIYFH